MKKYIPIFLLLLTLISVFETQPIHADTNFLVNTNLGSPQIICQGGTCFAGECFTMPGTSYFLTSVQLSISKTGNPAGSNIMAQISSVTGTPRSCLSTATSTGTGVIFTSTTTLSDSDLGTSLAFKTFNFNSPTLVANTLYEVDVRFGCSGACSGTDYFNAGYSNIGQPAGQNGNFNVNGGGWGCTPSNSCPATQDIGFILTGIAQGGGVSSGNQCIGNCNPYANSQWNSQSLAYNFNISTTLFYFEAIQLNDAVVANVTTMVAANYNTTFGLTLYLGLFSTHGACPNQVPGNANCPFTLVKQQAFPNPLKGLQTMTVNTAFTTGTWIAPAVSASRSGLNLNDTTTAIGNTLYLTNGIMPALISAYAITKPAGTSKINLRANVISTTSSGGSTTPGVCNNDLACFLILAILALFPNNLQAGGIAFIFIYSMATMAILFVGTAWFDRETGMKIPIPIFMFPAVFVMWSIFFFSIGAVSPLAIVMEILILSILFAGTLYRGITGSSGSSE